MMAFWFARTKYQPAYDAARAHALLADCREVWLEPLDAKQKAQAQAFIKEAEPLLVHVFAASPFLTRLIRTRPHVLADFVAMGDAPNDKKFIRPEQIIDTLLQNLPQEAAHCENRAELMACFRHARHKLALVTALADIADYWTVEKTTAALSDFADMAVRAALDWLLAEAQHEGKRIGQEAPAQSGLTILAMGKHGGRELNYSSDIDLVAFYEPSRLALAKDISENRFFVTLVQDLVSVLQTATEDGHVFRVDLRLRPDPGATQIAISLPAAVLYYETMGQNWERAAFIKARPIAGDIALGEEFLAIIQPFIWRRNLDFAAIEDVHAMKRQIHVLRGHREIAVEGHNVKLGRGGIREIEFFVQTQQLIAGGRDASLRGAATCDVLYALAKAEWISEETAQELVAAYYYLRRVEHRIQMIDDEQTHILPKQKDDMARFARFMNYADRAEFAAALTKQLDKVQRHYAALFEAGEALAAKTGNLVFTGAQDDPDTLATLAEMGFTNPAHMAAQIRNWHTGRFAATHTQRAKELLTRLMPQLLEALAATPNPDFAFARFHDFLANLPAGVQLFSLFQSNPHLLHLIADIVGTAPRLSGILSRRPSMLNSLLEADFNRPLPDAQALIETLEAELATQEGFETKLDFMRIWARDAGFRTGAQLLSNQTEPQIAARDFTNIAAACIYVLQNLVLDDLSAQYGRPEKTQFAVLGMGKLGSQEMTAASDLDLIMICDSDDFSRTTETAKKEKQNVKPLSYDVFYARVARRLISALTVQTAEGGLFEVDMRLRPSGKAGTLVTKLNRFGDYQADHAWTWEHIALTRARVMTGDATLRAQIEAIIETILCRKRDSVQVKKDAIDMRQRIGDNFPAKNLWDMKHANGGLVDIDFIIRVLQLIHAHQVPQICHVGTHESLRLLGEAGFLKAEAVAGLQQAWHFQFALLQILRLCLDELPAADTSLSDTTPSSDTTKSGFSESLHNLLCHTVNLPSLKLIEAELEMHRQCVRRHFATYLEV